MVRQFLRGMIVCFGALILFAATSQGAENGKEKCFLWRVKGTAGTAYLFGSVHLARSDSYPLPRQVEESFAAAQTLALEADPDTAKAPEMQQRLLLAAVYPGGDTLRQHLSKETYDLAVTEMTRVGVPVEQFAKTKPWFLAMTIELLELQQLGYSAEYGFDLYFAGKARGKKKIVELESVDYQIDLLNGFSDRDQELFLLYTIKDMATVRSEMDGLMRAWRTGDAKEMEKIVTRPLTDYPDTRPIYDKLFYQRNREMTGKVEKLLHAGETSFVVVGAAHLVGTEGVVELLKRKGYKVEQL